MTLNFILLESFIGGIFGICMIILCFYGFFWLMSLLSKASGKSITHRGKVISTPDDFDEFSKANRERINRMKSFLSSFPDKTSNIKKAFLNDKTVDKIAALRELQALKDKGTIDESEFSLLKAKILK